MSERIETMRSAFHAAGHEVDAVGFARAMLDARRREVSRQFAEVGIVSAAALELARTELGDPADPRLDRPVTARVNAGRWIADCECGGAEYVDEEMLVFMCAACWNRVDGHQWRPVVVPRAAARAAGEAVLLARPDPLTRNWRPGDGETVPFLRRENRGRGLAWRVPDLAAR